MYLFYLFWEIPVQGEARRQADRPRLETASQPDNQSISQQPELAKCTQMLSTGNLSSEQTNFDDDFFIGTSKNEILPL